MTNVDDDAPIQPPAPPRWVRALGMAAVLLVLVIGVLHLTGMAPGGMGVHLMPGQP